MPAALTVFKRRLPDLPLVVWLILLTLALGLLSGDGARSVIAGFNAGWGAAVGEFALILLPAFTLAAAIERLSIRAPPAAATGLAPFAGAAMVCPDTAFAALSSTLSSTGVRGRLSIAFGAYAGFKLLPPAGPLIVATSLGAAVDGALLMIGAAVFVAAWLTGIVFARALTPPPAVAQAHEKRKNHSREWRRLLPLALLPGLLVAGVAAGEVNAWLDFATDPKGALLLTAALMLTMLRRGERRACVETGLKQTAALLLLIGAASAFGAVLTDTFAPHAVFAARGGWFTLFALFALAALFKLLQGSSMATFAVAGPLAAPLAAAGGIPPAFAVWAVCLGSFVAVLPNDSFYWLTRRHALPGLREARALAILAGGSTAQAVAGLAVLSVCYALAR